MGNNVTCVLVKCRGLLSSGGFYVQKQPLGLMRKGWLTKNLPRSIIAAEVGGMGL